MSPKLRKAIGIIKYLFLLLVILFLLLVGAVNLPVVHKALTKKANTILLENGIPLHIGKITLLLNGKIGVNELAMIVPPNDTIIYIDKLRVDFSLMPLFSNRIFINEIILNEAVINMVSDSITNQLQIISALNPTGKESEKPQTDSTKTASSWDIDARTIRLKNIRFLYNDANGGILVKEKLDEAKIDLEKFSLTNRQIDIKSVEIDKPVGMVAIWEGKEKPAEEITESSPWLIKAKNLEINDLIFTLEQPDIGQQIDVALKNGNISLQKLDLEKEEILVNSIELKEPEVTFFNENKVQSEPTQTNFSETISIPMSPWTIISDELKIIDGNLNYITSNGSESATLDKWLPVSKLNTTFGKILLSPGGYNLNLEKTSFNLDTTLQIESGSINFELDSLQNTALNIKLSALLNNKKGWFIKKQYLNFNANIDGNQSALQIRELGILSTTGLKFNVTGNVQQPLKMENSVCDLRFASGSVSRDLLAPLINFLSPKTALPKFRPFMISGEIKNSLLNPAFNLNISSQSGNIKTSGRYNLKNSSGKLQAAFSNILLSELFEDTYPEHITGTINLNGSFSSGKMPEGEAAIKIDSVRYKNKTTKNIFVEAESHNTETKFIVQAADNSLNVDLKAFVNYNNTTDFSGTLEGFFEADLFELNLINEPYAGNGNIISSFSYSPNNLTASLGLNDINISNKNSDANIEKIQFKLNKNDSIIESDIEADFLVAKFFSRASLIDFENAWDSTSLTTAISIDSTNFINLKAITNLEHFNLDAKVKHNSFFNLFYPDSVLNFSDIVIQFGKNKTDSLVSAKVSTDWLSYNDFKIFKPNILANVTQNQLILKIDNDSTVKDQLKFGKMGVDINVLPSSIKSKFILLNKADSLMHMISIEAQQKDERVIFKSGTSNWIINKKPFDLMPIEFLTWDKTEKYFIANLGLHSEEKHIELVGNSSDTVELNLKNFELNNPLIHGIIGFSPQGFIHANIKYNGKKNDELNFNIEMHKMGLDSIYLDLITVDGHLIADSTGIIESELIVLADDSLSLYAEMLTNNQRTNFW